MFLFVNMLQAVRIRILLAMVILVSSTHFPQKKSATFGSLGDPENPEMKKFSVWPDLDIILTNFIVRVAWGRARMMLVSMMTRANMVACRLHCRANPPDQAGAGGTWWWGSRILTSWRIWSLGVQAWAVGPIVGLLDLIHGLPTQTSSCRRGFLAAEGVQERKRAAPFASASAQVKSCTLLSHARAKLTLSDTGSFLAVGRHVSKPFSCCCRSSSALTGMTDSTCEFVMSWHNWSPKIIQMDTNGRPDLPVITKEF